MTGQRMPVRRWKVVWTASARRQRLGFNRIVRRVLDGQVARLSSTPWLWGRACGLSGLWRMRFGWYGQCVYSIVPERGEVLVQLCRWESADGYGTGVAVPSAIRRAG